MPTETPVDLEKISPYLKRYIVQQDPSLYTPIDHASWRYIMRVSKDFFSTKAHPKYLDGLEETGIATERIPLIEEMDACLRNFGWRAVAVSGFIPVSAFIEFESLGILPIACDMRKLEHIHYTPAPDIVHEAAGHAPLIADPEYRRFLRTYGETARKAIYSAEDMAVYEAIRNLSEVKEDPASTSEDIAAGQKQLEDSLADLKWVSESTQLSRLFWWTTEYGLVGSMENPQIYGAGLLSSVGESYGVYNTDVKKVPFSVDCANVDYDITKPQPQLFVIPDFPSLITGVNEFAKTMAYQKGGRYGLDCALRAATTTTAELDSGLQISGTLTKVHGESEYLQYSGPCQLSFVLKELPGHGVDYHAEGFGSPVGLLADGRNPADLQDSDFKKGKLVFASGVEVAGDFQSSVRQNGKALIAAFKNCTVTFKDQTLFEPAWGTFDMACGAEVVSVFGGAAQRSKYLKGTGSFDHSPGRPKTNLTPENEKLNELYAKVRELRQSGKKDGKQFHALFDELERIDPKDWLLRLELLELIVLFKLKTPAEQKIRTRLKEIEGTGKVAEGLIPRGLKLLQ